MDIEVTFGGGRRGILTCDHPASCYNLPVVVDGEGEAYGPAEAGIVVVDPGDAEAAIVRRARKAGFTIQCANDEG